MNIIRLMLFPAYRRGWNDARLKGFVCNPYSEQAIEDNYDRGLGGSPHWHTEYRPFINWENGRSDYVFDRWLEEEHKKERTR